MSTVFSPPTKVAPYLFLLEWTGTAPFRIFDYYQYKYLATNTDATQMLVTSPFENQCQAIQILDATEGALDGVTYPGLARVQWRGQKHAIKYAVDNGRTILNWTPEDGRGYYDYVFDPEVLGAINEQIVNLTSYDSEGNTVGTQLAATSLVSVPLMFNFDLTYDSGTTTITVGLV